MFFKFSGRTGEGRGSEVAKRFIGFHLNHRPNKGQQKEEQKKQDQNTPGKKNWRQKRKGQWEQEEDLRRVLDNKRAKTDAGKKGGEKNHDRGNSSKGNQSSGRTINIYGGTNYFY